MKTYNINDIFCSLQGEGIRAGTRNVFIRFAGCNQTCRTETHGFDCDTEFVSHRKMTMNEIEARVLALWGDKGSPNVIFTGGEPALSLDDALVSRFGSDLMWFCAIETNGSVALSDYVKVTLDWITCSPKVAEHAIRLQHCDEVKYVRNVGQGIPVPAVEFRESDTDYHKLLSPAFDGEDIVLGALEHCMLLIDENPEWRLTMQKHKVWDVR